MGSNRPRAHVNLVAEELLNLLSLIGKPEKSLWLTEPKTVEMMTGPGDLKKPRPGIFLEVVEAAPDMERRVVGPLNPEKADFLIHCIVEDVNDPSGACHDLMADVARSIRENPQLDPKSGVLQSGRILHGRRKASIESAEGGSGFAVGFVEAQAFYLTSNAAP